MSGIVRAPAARAYALVADYRTGHTRIVPPRYFRNLLVESGGYGAGTIITYEVLLAGRVQKARAVVAEPEPGRVLTETDAKNGTLTTFTVEPTGAQSCRVTISTDVPIHAGLLGWFERRVIRSMLSRIYVDELALIDTVATSDESTARNVDASAGSAAS